MYEYWYNSDQHNSIFMNKKQHHCSQIEMVKRPGQIAPHPSEPTSITSLCSAFSKHSQSLKLNWTKSSHIMPGSTVCKTSFIGMTFKFLKKNHLTNYRVMAKHNYYSCFKSSHVVLNSSHMDIYNSHFPIFDIKWWVKHKFKD